jgi:hypothetical protein
MDSVFDDYEIASLAGTVNQFFERELGIASLRSQ